MNPQEQPLRLPPLADAGIRADTGNQARPGRPRQPLPRAPGAHQRRLPLRRAAVLRPPPRLSPIGDVAHGLPDYAAYLKYLNANAPWISAPAPRDTLRL